MTFTLSARSRLSVLAFALMNALLMGCEQPIFSGYNPNQAEGMALPECKKALNPAYADYYRCGDVNHDGVVSPSDAQETFDFAMNVTQDVACCQCGDVNGNGRIAPTGQEAYDIFDAHLGTSNLRCKEVKTVPQVSGECTAQAIIKEQDIDNSNGQAVLNLEPVQVSPDVVSGQPFVDRTTFISGAVLSYSLEIDSSKSSIGTTGNSRLPLTKKFNESGLNSNKRVVVWASASGYKPFVFTTMPMKAGKSYSYYVSLCRE